MKALTNFGVFIALDDFFFFFLGFAPLFVKSVCFVWKREEDAVEMEKTWKFNVWAQHSVTKTKTGDKDWIAWIFMRIESNLSARIQQFSWENILPTNHTEFMNNCLFAKVLSRLWFTIHNLRSSLLVNECHHFLSTSSLLALFVIVPDTCQFWYTGAFFIEGHKKGHRFATK